MNKKLQFFYVVIGYKRNKDESGHQFKFLAEPSLQQRFIADVKFAKRFDFEDLALDEILGLENQYSDDNGLSGFYEVRKIIRIKKS